MQVKFAIEMLKKADPEDVVVLHDHAGDVVPLGGMVYAGGDGKVLLEPVED